MEADMPASGQRDYAARRRTGVCPLLPASIATQFMKDEYPTGKADLMAAFMLRGQELTRRGGTWAMIDLPSWMSLKSFEGLRYDLLRTQRIASMVHLGRGVFGSDFGSVAFVIDNVDPGTHSTGVYRRLFEQHVDVRSVATIEALFLDRDYNQFQVAQADFAAIPGSPIVYWLSEKMRAAFKSGEPLGEVAELRQGHKTANNDRFLREWWEVSESRTGFNCSSRADAEASSARWFPYNKGGEFRRWYGNQEFVVNWEHDGAELRAFGSEDGGRPKSRVQATEFYFRPSISWPEVSSGAAAFRAFPVGFIFDSTGSSGFSEDGTRMAALLAIANSSVSSSVLDAVAPGLRFDVGQVAKIPVLESVVTDSAAERMESLVSTARYDWDAAETSWNFGVSPLVALRDGA